MGKWSDNLNVIGKPESPVTSLSLLPAADASVLSVLNELTYTPDPAIFGLSRQSCRYNCRMGHNDIPAIVLWFPIADKKIARFWSPPTHGERPKIQLTIHSRETDTANEK